MLESGSALDLYLLELDEKSQKPRQASAEIQITKQPYSLRELI